MSPYPKPSLLRLKDNIFDLLIGGHDPSAKFAYLKGVLCVRESDKIAEGYENADFKKQTKIVNNIVDEYIYKGRK